MNWIKHLIHKQRRNPLLKKIERFLAASDLKNNLAEIFYIGGCEYNEESYKQMLLAISSNNLRLFFDRIAYDTQKDDLELYLLKYKSAEPKLVILLDPFELFETERILNILPATEKLDLLGEKIYP